jgi:hypothetical protein
VDREGKVGLCGRHRQAILNHHSRSLRRTASCEPDLPPPSPPLCWLSTAIENILIYSNQQRQSSIPTPYITSYLRILQIVQTDPSYISKGTNKQEKTPLDYPAILDSSVSSPDNIEQLYVKDVFVCDSNGLSIFCTHCNIWNPDRIHHCSEVGRCVRRMDHFCPWVGNIVSGTTMKPFLQFTVYASLFYSGKWLGPGTVPNYSGQLLVNFWSTMPTARTSESALTKSTLPKMLSSS